MVSTTINSTVVLRCGNLSSGQGGDWPYKQVTYATLYRAWHSPSYQGGNSAQLPRRCRFATTYSIQWGSFQDLLKQKCRFLLRGSLRGTRSSHAAASLGLVLPQTSVACRKIRLLASTTRHTLVRQIALTSVAMSQHGATVRAREPQRGWLIQVYDGLIQQTNYMSGIKP